MSCHVEIVIIIVAAIEMIKAYDTLYYLIELQMIVPAA